MGRLAKLSASFLVLSSSSESALASAEASRQFAQFSVAIFGIVEFLKEEFLLLLAYLLQSILIKIELRLEYLFQR